MKKLKAVLLILLLPFVFFLFAGCRSGTRLSEFTGVSGNDIVSINYSHPVQSMALYMKEKYYSTFFQTVNVEYEEYRGGAFDYAENYSECMCYRVALKDNKYLNLDYFPNKKMYATYFDGENYFYYVSRSLVYIPWYITYDAK